VGLVAYLTGNEKRDRILRAFAQGARFLDTSHSLVGGVSVFVGFDCSSDDRILECKERGLPYLHLDHAYFNRGYVFDNFRVSVNNVYQNQLWDVPGDRISGVALRPWRQGRDVVVIVPSPKIQKVLCARDWVKRTTDEIKKHTDRNIVVKEKGPGLQGYLNNAHCVVSLASVAEVEALKYGVPVFTSEHSPAAPISERDLSRIETPAYPDREAWLRTLTYSQFHTSEMARGYALETICRLARIQT
jgi:hypothetical protein